MTKSNNSMSYDLAAPLKFGAINWIGLKSLYFKEVQRFSNVWIQTIAAPVVTGLLFLAVLQLSIGDKIVEIKGLDFSTFLVPGIIVMSMMQNAFANCSSSIMVGKVQGFIIDVLLPPLGHQEHILGWLGGGITRGVVVGLAMWFVSNFFIPIGVYNIFWIISHTILGCTFMALIGIIGGLWAEKFDHIAIVSNFIITPLTFLSGTFYSIDRLPDVARTIASFNPLFFVIDGVRFGFTGVSDSNVLQGLFVLLILDIILISLLWVLLKSGWRLRN